MQAFHSQDFGSQPLRFSHSEPESQSADNTRPSILEGQFTG
jgi:hypothetical protein